MQKIAIIGPSHAKQISLAIRRREFKPSQPVHTRGFQAAPVFAEPVLNAVQQVSGYDRIYLYVPGSFRFNQFYCDMVTGLMLLPRCVYRNAVKHKEFYRNQFKQDPEIVSIMDQHLIRWLNFYKQHFPQIRFIFWCEFLSKVKREDRQQLAPSVDRLTYDDWMSLYSNSICVYDFLASIDEPISGLCIGGGNSHKNAAGRELL